MGLAVCMSELLHTIKLYAIDMQNQSDSSGFGFCNRCRIIPVHREIPAPSSRPSTAGEPTLLTTPPSSPDPIADPQSPPVSGPTHLDRIEAKVHAIQQQALDTQKKLEQLQANPVEEADLGLGSELPLFAAAIVLAIVLVAYAGFNFWKRQRPSNANDEDLDDRPTRSRFAQVSKASTPFEASTARPSRTAAIVPEFRMTPTVIGA